MKKLLIIALLFVGCDKEDEKVGVLVLFSPWGIA